VVHASSAPVLQARDFHQRFTQPCSNPSLSRTERHQTTGARDKPTSVSGSMPLGPFEPYEELDVGVDGTSYQVEADGYGNVSALTDLHRESGTRVGVIVRSETKQSILAIRGPLKRCVGRGSVQYADKRCNHACPLQRPLRARVSVPRRAFRNSARLLCRCVVRGLRSLRQQVHDRNSVCRVGRSGRL
jgi:hypothetical protein